MTAPPIVVPQDPVFIENLILQRTGPFIRMGGSEALQAWFRTGAKVQLSAFLADRDLTGAYLAGALAEIAGEADALAAVLPPESFETLVSVGAGNGLLELMLARRHDVAKLVLIDIETSDLNQHGFATRGSGYASLEATRALLVGNGIGEDRIVTVNPTRQPLPDLDFSLLISTLSMGFHYPCDDYATYILDHLAPGGRVVIDKRRGAPDAGFARISAALRLERSEAAQKSDRVFLARS